MTDVQAPVTVWVPGGSAAPIESPVALAASHVAAGLRLQAGGAVGVRVREVREGVSEVVFHRGDEPLTFAVTVPATDAVAWWRPGSTVPHGTIPPSWAEAVDATALQGIPVGALLTGRDLARLAYAVDAGTGVVHVRAGLVEETADFVVMVTVTGQVTDVRLHLDSSMRPFADVVPEAGRWLQGAAGHRPAPGATDPVLCTWYFAHQHVSAEAVLAQADRAVEMGFGTVIVDDGWQTTTHSRGYGSCGDWGVATGKFPDPAGLVAQLRRRGLRTMWWIGTPFVGYRSHSRDLGLATMADEPDLETEILDPRDGAARRHLVGRIRDLVAATTADGLKLDFLERFGWHADAVVELMDEIVAELRGLGTEPLIEFREPYVHHAVARFASMIRIGDCPLSAVQNRVGIVDLRLARPGVPIHSEPVMWAEGDGPERVAHHLLNSLFGVPQVSMDLLRLPADQADTLAFWMGIWRENRDLLLHGRLLADRPDLRYPVVHARSGERHLIARYAPHPVVVPATQWTELLLANADDSVTILLNETDDLRVDLTVQDARGRLVDRADLVMSSGPVVLDIPDGGLARLRRVGAQRT